MKYSPNWLATILAAIAIHFLAAVTLEFVLPKSFTAQIPPDVTEISWVDVDLVDDFTVIDEEFIPIETPAEIDTSSEFDIIELPPLVEPPKFEMPEIPKLNEPEPPPPVTKPKEESPPKVEPEKKEEPAEESSEKQELGSDAITISEVYPTKSFGFKGYVSISVTIGKDGKVKSAEVLMPSGIKDVDESSLDAAKKWTFKPALDTNNKPMERVKVITFDYNKISDNES
ncbi:MAG: TonB family protein [Selenomonadaceae bacterium]|nr:TonB family protein [Selenomonadaceae bacterium]